MIIECRDLNNNPIAINPVYITKIKSTEYKYRKVVEVSLTSNLCSFYITSPTYNELLDLLSPQNPNKDTK
jgi:hypothetical protein